MVVVQQGWKASWTERANTAVKPPLGLSHARLSHKRPWPSAFYNGHGPGATLDAAVFGYGLVGA